MPGRKETGPGDKEEPVANAILTGQASEKPLCEGDIELRLEG